ncbi:hypothetical protein EDC15_11830 [Acetobacter aceti NBRC 14818]|nr:hypothetical protein EDC15_11830 [Acetobacter aceti NBRC 14818]
MSLCPSVQTVLTGAYMIITAELLLRADVAQNLDLGGGVLAFRTTGS